MSDKKLIRKNFRENSLKRDKYRCVCCGIPGFDRQGGDLHKKFHNQGINIVPLDVHHITPRNEMENGGYVFENGISVCSDCHLKCEYYFQFGTPIEGFSIEKLYELIGSSYEKAKEADGNL